MAERAALVSSLVSVTSAPGITPCASRTAPRNAPWYVCASRLVVTTNATIALHTTALTLRYIVLMRPLSVGLTGVMAPAVPTRSSRARLGPRDDETQRPRASFDTSLEIQR